MYIIAVLSTCFAKVVKFKVAHCILDSRCTWTHFCQRFYSFYCHPCITWCIISMRSGGQGFSTGSTCHFGVYRWLVVAFALLTWWVDPEKSAGQSWKKILQETGYMYLALHLQHGNILQYYKRQLVTATKKVSYLLPCLSTNSLVEMNTWL